MECKNSTEDESDEDSSEDNSESVSVEGEEEVRRFSDKLAVPRIIYCTKIPSQ